MAVEFSALFSSFGIFDWPLLHVWSMENFSVSLLFMFSWSTLDGPLINRNFLPVLWLLSIDQDSLVLHYMIAILIHVLLVSSIFAFMSFMFYLWLFFFPLHHLESTDTATGVPHLCPTRGAVGDTATTRRCHIGIFFFFFPGFQIHAYSHQIKPIHANSSQIGSYRPKLPKQFRPKFK